MTPNKNCWINGVLVEEYTWGHKLLVYVDNHITDETFDEAIARLKKEKK